MNFQELLSRMKELDQPVQEAGMEECGGPMPSAMNDTSSPPPSMSINMNAQGLDNIADLMQLLKKVNPDLGPKADAMVKPMMTDPVIAIGHSDSDEPSFSLGMDKDGDDELDGEIDPTGADDDGGYQNKPKAEYADIDAVTTDAGGGMNGPKHPKDLRIKDPSPYENEAYANEPDENYEDHLKMIKHLAGGMNKEKEMVKHGYQQGDNPKAMKESDDPLAEIKNDLYARLQEFKSR